MSLLPLLDGSAEMGGGKLELASQFGDFFAGRGNPPLGSQHVFVLAPFPVLHGVAQAFLSNLEHGVRPFRKLDRLRVQLPMTDTVKHGPLTRTEDWPCDVSEAQRPATSRLSTPCATRQRYGTWR